MKAEYIAVKNTLGERRKTVDAEVNYSFINNPGVIQLIPSQQFANLHQIFFLSYPIGRRGGTVFE
jgi:hypothetical protein